MLAFVIHQLYAARPGVQLQLGAAKGIGQQQAVVILAGLLPEETGVHLLAIGEVSKGPARLVLAQVTHLLLMLTPLRRVRTFTRAFRRMNRAGGKYQACKW